MKNKKFPSRTEILKVLKKLESAESTRLLPENAPLVDKIKFELCQSFVSYMNETNTEQKELAELLGIDKSVMSKITHYHIDVFTIDRLVRLLSKLEKKISIRIS